MTPPTDLDSLDDGALDRLPFGVVRIAPSGRIDRYNRTESERSGIPRWRALGRNYFRDVAAGRATELAETIAALDAGNCIRVEHTFRGHHRETRAVVDLSRSIAGHVYLCIRAA